MAVEMLNHTKIPHNLLLRALKENEEQCFALSNVILVRYLQCTSTILSESNAVIIIIDLTKYPIPLSVTSHLESLNLEVIYCSMYLTCAIKVCVFVYPF